VIQNVFEKYEIPVTVDYTLVLGLLAATTILFFNLQLLRLLISRATLCITFEISLRIGWPRIPSLWTK
jgi:hypothetical protein